MGFFLLNTRGRGKLNIYLNPLFYGTQLAKLKTGSFD
jgi:hypothetical protein